MKRHTLKTLAALAAALALPAVPLAAWAAYPDKPVKIVVGFTPGGTADSVARLMASALGARLGQSFFVETKAGANGNLATDYVSRAPADGYTLFFTSIGHAVNPSLYKEAKYDPVKDFTPIGQVLSAPNVLVVPGNSPFNTARELIAYAKAHPGKLNFASSGMGASVHLSGELFKQKAGIDMVHIPYKGTGSLMPDLLSGTVNMAFPNLPSALPFVKSGKLKALGVTTAKRSDSAPQIPTLAEAGVPGYDMSTWYGLIGPARMPADVVQKLSDALQQVMHDPEVRNKLIAQGVDPVSGTPQEFGAFIQRETDNWAGLLKKINIQVE
ncbi:MAG: tripartite tricarboxylate transporter substrate binding protein [Pseudomonadota bacterium]